MLIVQGKEQMMAGQGFVLRKDTALWLRFSEDTQKGIAPIAIALVRADLQSVRTGNRSGYFRVWA